MWESGIPRIPRFHTRAGQKTQKEGKKMENKHFSELMNTLECLETVAADLMDTVANTRAELEQTFEMIEQTAERRASA